MTTETSGERLGRLRRADSTAKAAQVHAALDATATAGGPFTVADIARKAHVSRRFIYDHPELRADIDLKATETTARFSGGLTATARLTTASVRADAENTRAENRRLRDRVRSLDTRLSSVLGEEVAAELAGQGVLAAERPFRDEIDTLHLTIDELTEELRRANEDLHAARQANRDLIVDLNRRNA